MATYDSRAPGLHAAGGRRAPASQAVVRASFGVGPGNQVLGQREHLLASEFLRCDVPGTELFGVALEQRVRLADDDGGNALTPRPQGKVQPVVFTQLQLRNDKVRLVPQLRLRGGERSNSRDPVRFRREPREQVVPKRRLRHDDDALQRLHRGSSARDGATCLPAAKCWPWRAIVDTSRVELADRLAGADEPLPAASGYPDGFTGADRRSTHLLSARALRAARCRSRARGCGRL